MVIRTIDLPALHDAGPGEIAGLFLGIMGDQLFETLPGILDELFQVALADSQITDDERQLLLRAMELVPTLRSVAPTAASVS